MCQNYSKLVENLQSYDLINVIIKFKKFLILIWIGLLFIQCIVTIFVTFLNIMWINMC